MAKSSSVMKLHFTAQIKSLDYIYDVIKWLRSIGCKAYQYKSTWTILCIVPLGKVNEVMAAHDDNFGW